MLRCPFCFARAHSPFSLADPPSARGGAWLKRFVHVARRVLILAPAGRRCPAGDDGPALVSTLDFEERSPRSVRLQPLWSSVSPGCRPPPHLSPRRKTWARDAVWAGRSCVEAARLREPATGFAEGASLWLQRTGRIHSATPWAFLRQLVSPNREVGQRHAASLRCPSHRDGCCLL